jgi:hypothetical protein
MLYTLAVVLALFVVGQSQTADCAWVQDMIHFGGYFSVSMDRCNWQNQTGSLMSWKYQCLGGHLYYLNYTDRFCTQGDNGGADITADFPSCAYNCGASSCYAVSYKSGHADYASSTSWFTKNGGTGESEGDNCAAEVAWTRETGENLLAVGPCVDMSCVHEWNAFYPDVNGSQKIGCIGEIPYLTNYSDTMCQKDAHSDTSGNQLHCSEDGTTTYAFCGATAVVVTPLLALAGFVASLLL